MLDQIKLQHFRNLISLSAADGRIDELERIALSKIAFERGIPVDRLNVMIRHAAEYQYLIPQNRKDRSTQLEEMIDLAMADGDFAKAEYELIMMVSERLGFSRDEAGSFIQAHREKRQRNSASGS